MELLHQLITRLKTMRKRQQLDRDLKEEIAFHLEMMREKRLAQGTEREEAGAASHRQFGNEVRVKEQLRTLWTLNWVETWLQDLRYAVRTMRKTPVLATVVVISLSLGIGANTAIFSLLDAAMLRSLPVPDPRSLTLLTWTSQGWPGQIVEDLEGTTRQIGGKSWSYSFSNDAYQYIRDHNHVFEQTFAFAANHDRANVGLGGAAESANVQAVSGNFFLGMRVAAYAGRSILPDDDSDAAVPVAMVSHSFWQRRMGADVTAVGKTIVVNSEPLTVVGVLPAGFYGIEPGSAPDVWVTLSTYVRQMRRLEEFDIRGPKSWWLAVAGRNRPGVTDAQAQFEANTLLHQLLQTGRATPLKDEEMMTIGVEPLSRGLDSLRRQFSTPLMLLMGMVGMVLLIACANVAGLLLARAAARQREIGVRLSLGASRWRVVRQLLTESVLLAVMAGISALLVAKFGSLTLIQLIASGRNPVDLTVTLNPNILLFTFALSIFCGFLFGLLPALRATRVDLYPVLKQSGGQFITGSGSFFSGKLLVAGQLALCLLLLISAGLLLRTLRRLQNVELGFDARNLITFRVQPGLNDYKGERLLAYYAELQRRIAQVPGVETVGMSQLGPIGSGQSSTDVVLPGYTQPGKRVEIHRHMVGGDYFSALRIPVLLGRAVGEQDTASTPLVAAVNQRTVRDYFHGDDPVGKTIDWGNPKKPMPIAIVGVVGDVKYNRIREDVPPTLYLSYLQRPQNASFLTFLVRTHGEPKPIMQSIQRQALQLDANVPVLDLRTELDVLEQELMLERLFAMLSSVFSGMALVLACVGLYGTISYTVARRTNEIGIRMALGADREIIVRMVLKDTFIVMTAGLLVGLPLAWFAVQLLKNQLFGLSAQDPIALATAVGVIVVVSALAGLLPARKASRIDPMVALRYE